MGETWRSVPDFNYEVSDLGNVRHLKRPTKMIKPFIGRGNSRNYLIVTLWAAGKRKRFILGRLVLTAFDGPKPSNIFACHCNDDTMDNRYSNLVWADQSTNEKHKTYKPCECKDELAMHHAIHGYCVRPGCHCQGYKAAS
jgi:hypothetical protein